MTMTTKKLPLAIALAAFAMACSDGSTPTSAFAPNGPLPAISSVTTTTPPVAFGSIELCKTSNVAGTFGFNTTTNAASGSRVDDGTPDVTITIGAGGGTVCRTVYSGSTLPNASGANTFTIVETANAATLTNIDVIRYLAPGPTYDAGIHLSDTEDEATRTAVLKINSDMSRRVTFTNTTTVTTTGCTYTKGWYRNHGSSTIDATIDGRTIAQQQAIFDATPGKPGSVTWGDDNLLLNLYQQLLAALNNLNGDATGGPPAVDAAISAALAGTGGTGLNITTTLTHDQMADLVETLSDFNEGTFEGWPHCEDN
jgi:hypothetical protein